MFNIKIQKNYLISKKLVNKNVLLYIYFNLSRYIKLTN